MTIEELRVRIDRIDEQLVALLNVRAACAIEIGRLKRDRALPVRQPAREADIKRHARMVSERLGGPLGGDAVMRLFEQVIEETQELETRAGRPDGSASHEDPQPRGGASTSVEGTGL